MAKSKDYSTPSALGLAKGVGGSEKDIVELQKFLQRFGYLKANLEPTAPYYGARALEAPEPKVGKFDEATETALRNYQKFHQLPITGELDEATIAEMQKPRCGFPDNPQIAGFQQFVAQGNRWDRTNLTYRIVNFTPDLTQAEIRAAMREALNLWSAVTRLTFTEVTGNADILISFVTGDHGDGNSFDGVGRVLAHAFYPPPNGGDIAGDAHFDDAETWTVNIPVPSGRIDLVTVAAHEFGHSLGLAHSSVSGALMFPTYSGPHRFLAQDDIDGIQSIYGGLKLAQAMWIHGHSMEIEYPDNIARVWRAGFYIEVEGKPNTNNWFHFAIPTKVIVKDNRLRVGSVMLLSETLSTQALIRDVHIYDGDVKIAQHNGVNLSGNAGFVRFNVPPHPFVRWGVGISIGVHFGGGSGSRVMRFKSAGCDFLS